MATFFQRCTSIILLWVVLVTLVNQGFSTPIPPESGNKLNNGTAMKCVLSANNSTNSSDNPEPEPISEPQHSSSHVETKNKTAVPAKEDQPKEMGKDEVKHPELPAASAKPTTKPATTKGTTTVKPKAVDVKTTSTSKPPEAAPLKIESREGKSLDLNKTAYEHASPEPEPEPESAKPHSGNHSTNKNETMHKENDKKTATPVVHETIEKKNASMTKEGKKPDDKDHDHEDTKSKLSLLNTSFYYPMEAFLQHLDIHVICTNRKHNIKIIIAFKF